MSETSLERGRAGTGTKVEAMTRENLDLRGHDLSRKNLCWADYRGADLGKANLSEAILRKASLSAADLRGADLSWADLRGADLSKANLSEANLREANLSGAELSEANLSGADLGGADLGKAELSGADLSGADLSEANLSGADLSEADLSEADLRWADLSGADLGGADLSGADLGGADLSGADLSAADLSAANLRKANLSWADLSAANLSMANLSSTVFGDVDLSEVKGLDAVKHLGPSTIGVDTLLASKGRIPEDFLRGCGVPPELLVYLPSVLGSMEAIQFYSCFISYSSKDEDFAKRLYSRFRDENLRVWFAPEDIKAGRKVHEQVDSAIKLHDKLLLVLSPSSMNSNWVRRELKAALKKVRDTGADVLFPVSIVPFKTIRDWKCLDSDTGEDMAEKVREYHVPTDFVEWKDHDRFEAAVSKLLDDLRAERHNGRDR